MYIKLASSFHKNTPLWLRDVPQPSTVSPSTTTMEMLTPQKLSVPGPSWAKQRTTSLQTAMGETNSAVCKIDRKVYQLKLFSSEFHWACLCGMMACDSLRQFVVTAFTRGYMAGLTECREIHSGCVLANTSTSLYACCHCAQLSFTALTQHIEEYMWEIQGQWQKGLLFRNSFWKKR